MSKPFVSCKKLQPGAFLRELRNHEYPPHEIAKRFEESRYPRFFQGVAEVLSSDGCQFMISEYGFHSFVRFGDYVYFDSEEMLIMYQLHRT